MNKRIIIIGAGASGMMAAIVAARAGAQVLLLEHNDRVGKKILATGNGRCNLTNLDQDISCYRCEDRGFVQQVLLQNDVQQTIRFFSDLGIYTRNRAGYIYPNSDQAAAVLDVLRMELERLQVEIVCDAHVTGIEKKGRRFRIKTRTMSYESAACILAAGSRAGNMAGADGSGYQLAQQAGHRIITPVPALVQLKSPEKWLKSVSGVRTTATVSLYVGADLTAQDTGELQFTAYGLSGIPTFQISRFAARALAQQKEVRVSLNFLPDFESDVLKRFLAQRISLAPEKTAEQFFIGLLNKRVGKIVLDAAGIALHKPVGSLSGEERERLQDTLQHFDVPISGTNTFKEAQVCAGGVPLDELVCPTMESELMKGLYIIGELADVDGACGGYNLQWAWSSGYTAGIHAAAAVTGGMSDA